MNALGAASLASHIAGSLPKDEGPQLKSPTDSIAVACHAGMLAVGFKLVGLGEEHRIEFPSEDTEPHTLPPEWNASSHSIEFRYSHPQSSMQYLLKVNRLGAKTVIYGIGMGDDKTTSFDVTTKDFISESSLPATPVSSSTSPHDAEHAIATVYISPSRLTDLGSLLRLNIIQKLVPGLQKEGYEDRSDDPSNPRDPSHNPPTRDPLRDDRPRPAQPNPLVDPSFGPRRPPVPAGEFPPPDFEDEYEMNRHPRAWPPQGGLGGGVPGYGERDLHPPGLGPRDPLYPGLGPGLGRPGGGGGMHMGFEDLTGRGREGSDPRAPPGARYDPPGPGFGPPRGGMGGGFGGPGGAPPNPFGGYGDSDFI